MAHTIIQVKLILICLLYKETFNIILIYKDCEEDDDFRPDLNDEKKFHRCFNGWELHMSCPSSFIYREKGTCISYDQIIKEQSISESVYVQLQDLCLLKKLLYLLEIKPVFIFIYNFKSLHARVAHAKMEQNVWMNQKNIDVYA